MTTPLSDPENFQFSPVERKNGDQDYDVGFAYALLASAPLPAVLRGDVLEDYIS